MNVIERTCSWGYSGKFAVNNDDLQS